MDLDNRSVQVLQTVASTVKISSKEIMEKYRLTRNQLDYALKKINDYLEENSYRKIIRSRNGSFVVDTKVVDDFSGIMNSESQLQADENSFLDEDHRLLVILLLIFSADYLSLYHFSESLEVSKNTIVSDIKKLKKQLSRHKLTIDYSRKGGYYFRGDEEAIRGLILVVTDQVMESIYNRLIFEKYLAIQVTEIEAQRRMLRLVEEELQVQYTDNRIQTAPYFLVLLDRRVKNEHLIEQRFGLLAKEIMDTNEYAAIVKVLAGQSMLPKSYTEHLYLCLYILSLKITDLSNIFSLNKVELRKHIELFIAQLEKNTIIQLNDKAQLIENLALHLTPAYYRIRYGLTSDYTLTDIVKNQLDPLFFIVKSSIAPLEEFFEERIPNDEIYLITMFIGAYMQKEKPINLDNTIVKAAVVCPNGIISSKLLEKTLDNWFPMIHFVSSFSIREFYEKEECLEVQLIFSTTPLTTEFPVIVVGNDLSAMNKTLIVNEVIQLIYKIDSYKLQPDHILSIVRKHLSMDDETEGKIRKELMISYNSIFQIQDQEILTNETKLNLSDLITKESIVILPNKLTWLEILQAATQNLIARGIVETSYLSHLEEQFPEVTPSIVLGNQIVIPHTIPENGARELGMCLAKIPQGFSSQGQCYRYVVVISAIDKKMHIQPMMQLLKIASDPKTIQRMDQAQDKDALLAIIQDFKK
ncbi:BglG family transcription antiterminator [Enterococcus raffinosus]|uniref:Ascorbate-specific PTS system EIIA component n=1 Tax=Enterococcus raffinosus TaxID=71452 RepID=A0AAW8TEA4_9ENTE|nr:BglG family transcription antiterminator [Enterococcus raffinosus]MDT2523373.1 BglG family transcription antiterminator [Enterococcus raffinosus]MDT2529357.1 BglG family transcription antiterminator [Enterococcus raffinosus]MDT2534212.1 BglG family transcription antiterminator [Enterococcus raffinosus]MDT2545282.1 BglG family transcription antiterminator [Enterococcus raffinosus]MDT2555248.1 BglG family transcription antiterminator [Enterococcus raffinosus]